MQEVHFGITHGRPDFQTASSFEDGAIATQFEIVRTLTKSVSSIRPSESTHRGAIVVFTYTLAGISV